MYQLLGRFLALDFCFHNALDTRSFMALNSATFSAAAAVKCKRNTLWLACWGGAISSVANIAWRPKKETRAGHRIVERLGVRPTIIPFPFPKETIKEGKLFFGMTDLQPLCFMKTAGHLPRDFRFVTPKCMKMFLGIPCKCPAKFTWNNYSVHPRCGESRWSNSIKPIDGSCDAIYFPGDIDDSRDSPQFFVGVFTIFFSNDNP